MNGLIYVAIAPNGKVYVGQTINFEERKRSHKRNSFNANREDYNSKFHCAIRKYGFENFKWEILENNISKDFLNIKECKWIENYNSYLDGLNSTKGGDDNPSNNAEIRLKISNTLKERFKIEKNPFYGKKHSEATKKKMIENSGRRGKAPWNKGRKGIYNKEVLEKMSISAKKRWSTK